jgi:hypothetical protein
MAEGAERQWLGGQVEGGPEAGAGILQARGAAILQARGDLPPGPEQPSSILWVLGGPFFRLGAAL